jgi:hypothetical protein
MCGFHTYSYICRTEKMDRWYRFLCIFMFKSIFSLFFWMGAKYICLSQFSCEKRICFTPIQTTSDGTTTLLLTLVFIRKYIFFTLRLENTRPVCQRLSSKTISCRGISTTTLFIAFFGCPLVIWIGLHFQSLSKYNFWPTYWTFSKFPKFQQALKTWQFCRSHRS